MNQTFFTILVLLIISDIIAAGVAALIMWQHRKENALAKYISTLLMSLVIHQLCQMIGGGIERPTMPTSFAMVFFGQAVRSFAVWLILLYLIGVIKNGKNGPPGANVTAPLTRGPGRSADPRSAS